MELHYLLFNRAVKSPIESYHIFDYQNVVGEELNCIQRRQNRQSQNGMMVKKVREEGKRKKRKTEMVAGHIQEVE